LLADVARRFRIQFPGAIYHVINRGNYRRDLFATAGAAKSFERSLGEAAALFGWQVRAFAAMRPLLVDWRETAHGPSVGAAGNM